MLRTCFGQNDPEFWRPFGSQVESASQDKDAIILAGRPLNKNFYGVWGPDKTRASAELETFESGINRMLARCAGRLAIIFFEPIDKGGRR